MATRAADLETTRHSCPSCGHEWADAPKLSGRELDILRLVAAGMTTENVALELSIAPGTVKAHLGDAFRKLGARSRAQAVMVAMTRGLLAA